jgi:RimJ/RimL family protein N-acetyltransferase
VTSLRSERLRIETLTKDEAAAIRSGDRSGRTWAADYPSDGDRIVADVIGEAGDHYDETSEIGVYQVRLISDGTAVGGIGFLSAPFEDEGEAEIGYGLSESARGQGYATEAVRAVLAFVAQHGVRRVVALTDPGNLASHAVLTRVGFARAGEVAGDEGVMLRWDVLVEG